MEPESPTDQNSQSPQEEVDSNSQTENSSSHASVLGSPSVSKECEEEEQSTDSFISTVVENVS